MDQDFIVDNEFAAVRVSCDRQGNSPRLKVTDLKSGKSGWLDALELETLAWLRHDELAPLLDPSASRWADGPDHHADRNELAAGGDPEPQQTAAPAAEVAGV